MASTVGLLRDKSLLVCRESADTAQAAEAASALCAALPELLQPKRPAVLRQRALASFGAAASALGRGHPAPLLGALPSVLATAKVEGFAALCVPVHAVDCHALALLNGCQLVNMCQFPLYAQTLLESERAHLIRVNGATG